MLNYNKTGLQIFDSFQVDFNLPKWKEKMKQSKQDGSNILQIPLSRRGNNDTVSIGGSFISSISSGVDGISLATFGSDSSESKKISLFTKLFGRKRLKRDKVREQEEIDAAKRPNFDISPPITLEEYNKIKEEERRNEVSEITVEEFFKSIKNSAEELVLVNERYESYESAIKHLQQTGQQTILERMSLDLEIYKAESQLYATGRRKLITEQNVIDFAKKAPRALELTWIKNFTRSIPKKVVDIKVRMDELGIFDNYTILHFNPYGTGSELTEKEKENQKDPILFGVILGSQKLYYVGDWIDEYCDLTFDKMVETLGESAISANDITANIEIPSEK